MRLSNRRKLNIYNFFDSLVIMTFFLGIIAFFLERYRIHVMGVESYLLIIVPFFLLVIYYLRGRQIFEYDSDGEALIFRNRNGFPFMHQNVIDEFPKYKLKSYDILNGFIFKRLYVTVFSKKGHPIILKYDISYLTKKEVADLKYSLSKTIKNNKEQNSQQTNA